MFSYSNSSHNNPNVAVPPAPGVFVVPTALELSSIVQEEMEHLDGIVSRLKREYVFATSSIVTTLTMTINVDLRR